MNLTDPYPVPPWTRPCSGRVSVPGSKSLTNRALLLAALSMEDVTLKGALFSRDSRLLITALRDLGIHVEADEARAIIHIRGQGGRVPAAEASLKVGNAGTAARFLTALVCLHPNGRYHLDGDAEMRQRPMEGLLHALREAGARFEFQEKEGHFPFTVYSSGLRGGNWTVAAGASSQMLSALMMVAPFAASPVHLRSTGARPAFVRMTEGCLRQFGATLEGEYASGYRIANTAHLALPGSTFAIEPDATAASYFLALPAVVGGCLTVRGLHENLLQGDLAFVGVLRSLGLEVRPCDDGFQSVAPATTTLEGGAYDFETFSDTFLTLAAIAPLLSGRVEIAGVGHTRHQECDRITAMAEGLARVGARVEEKPHGLVVYPFGDSPQERVDVVISTYRDHRVAMSFALLGCRDRFHDGRPWLAVEDPLCCSKTFPRFFELLNQLYQENHDG